MNYSEKYSDSKVYKQEYNDGFEAVIRMRQNEALKIREEYAKDIFKKPEKYREDFKKMLGWPLDCDKDDFSVEVKSEKISAEDGYSIYRMRFEILPGLWMTGLFFKMDGDDKKPLVIVQHGGLGSPELISGILGDTGNYNDMLKRVIKNNVHAFAPQTINWDNAEHAGKDYEVEIDRKSIDARLKRVGSSVTAIEVFGIIKILDYFGKENYVKNFGMVGLSYGGFYTLFTAAVEPRIKSAISCSFFNTRDEYGWSDWTWQNAAFLFDDAEIAALVYPRRLSLQIGSKDALFDYRYGEKSFERLKSMCQEVGTDWVELIVFDGTHEFYKGDEAIKRLIDDIRLA